MAAAYFENRFEADASFELYVRQLPSGRGYLLVAGLEQALDYLEELHFSDEEIDYLREHRMFRYVSAEFFEYLKHLRFTGEIWAMPEGTPAFGGEPLLRVTAPIIEAQIVETYLLATVTFQTMVATKAARLVEAAQGRGVVDFGTRRAHGPEAGLLAARAAYIGGCMGTSNVEAGLRFGIPTYGTVAHSFVMAHEREEDAFRNFARLFPETTILLVDTYDTLHAIDKIIAMNMHPRGVRLDSGNMAELSKQVRERLDAAGLRDTKIFVSGDLDEFSITRLLAQYAPVDVFAVGTALVTSSDAPSLGGVYKMVELHPRETARLAAAPEPKGVRRNVAELKHPASSDQRTRKLLPRYTAKFSPEKISYPGSKQVFRFADAQGCYARDLIACAGENYAAARPLLSCVMQHGQRLSPSPTLDFIRQHVGETLPRLPTPVRELRAPAQYPVQVSEQLQELLRRVRSEVA